MKKGLLLAWALFAAQSAFAQIEAWELSPQPGNQVSSLATTVGAGINAGILQRGAGVAAAAAGGSISSNGWFNTNGVPTTLADAIANNEYYEFTLPIQNCYRADITTVQIVLRSSNTGPNTATLRSSIDGFTADLGTANVTAASVLNTFNVNINGNMGTITFRLYGYGNAVSGSPGTAGTMRIGTSVVALDNDLIINGSTIQTTFSSITFANVSSCNNNGTNGDASDDYFTADITVNYTNPPTSGNLTLSGDVLAGGGALSVAAPFNATSTVFTGIRLKADGTASSVTATFGANSCAFTENNGPNVASCSAACSISSITFSNVSSCNNNGTIPNAADDYFTADISVTYTSAPATGNLALTGDVLAGGGPLSIAAPFTSPTVFAGVRLKADGTPSVVTAKFSADTICKLTVNNGPNIPSCSAQICTLNVTCPPQPNGVFSCTNPLPAPVTTLAGFQALGGNVTGTICGTLTFTSVTSPIDNCNSTSVTRTYTIFDDLPPANGIRDAGENFATCALTYTYAKDITPPTFNPNPPLPGNITISCTAPLPIAPTLTGTDNCGGGMVPPVIFINEFHYDNIGGDVGEFVEVAGTAGINLADYQIILYNGNGGVVYDTDALVGVIDNEGSGFGAISLAYPVNGIQNGTPDGIALYRISTNQVLQFLSYEGPFQAMDGPAMGMFATDVGVFEAGTEAIGLSLQLTGTGQVAADFTWVGPIAQSPGTLNAGQTINPLPASNAATFSQTEVAGPCAGSRIITRKWTLSDACNNQTTHTQVITVTDTDPPVLTPKPADMTISCNTPVPPPPAVVGTDACDPAGIINGPVWINEIHYDNTGTDANEFIEIAGRAGTNLGSGYELFLYNGSTGNMGGTYLNVPLSGIIPNQSNGYGTIAFFIPGIENGPSDGIAFVKGGTVLQFLSYEGVMTAIGGPANGMNSTDIGVSETGNEPLGQSLRLSGNGTVYANFVWNGPSAANPATPDAVNQGQTFPVQPPNGLPVTFNQTSTPGPCAQSQIIKRTWSTTDACGNTAVYTQTITVSDNAGPTIVCNNITVNLDIFGNVVVTQAQLLQSVSDNCAPANNITVTPPGPFTFTCLQQGTTQIVVLTATDQCGNTSSCAAQVTVNPFQRCTPKILISDPCVCKNNATTLFDGQFGETIKIESLAGQTWTIIAVNGLYLSSSPPPPSAPTPVPLGTLFVQNPINSGDYYFTGIHVDAIGYSITVQNNLGQIVTISNSCQYPNPTITADLNGPFCLFSNPVTLTGNPGDANIVSQGFTVNGVPATVFDPGQGVGQYIIVYTVNGGVPKAFGPNDPGCIQSITVYVNVIATPTNLVCNDLVYLSLDADCTEDILPDDILEGTYGCFDDYIVEIDRTLPYGNGPWEPGTVNANDIGKTYQVRVTHLVSGNKCWGNIKIEDKLPPVMNCTNFSIPCNTPDISPNYLFNTLGIIAALPAATDCQPVTKTYIDTETLRDCASGFTKTITRKWTAVDASGNSSTCIQTIHLTRPTLADLKFPPNYDGFQAPGFNCTAAYPTPDWIQSQGLQGYPWVFGRPDGCNFNWVFTDDLIPICDGTYKIFRRWTILNACAPGVIHFEQLIKVEDKQGPAMTCPPNTTVSVDPFSCCGTIDLPNRIIKDECSRVNNIRGMVVTFDPNTGLQTGMFTFGGTLKDFPGNNWWDKDTLADFGYTPCLPIGNQTVTYIAEDDCGNSRSCTFRLNVQDLVPPVAVCDQFTTVALGDDGKAVINAATFDDGSYDICCLKDITAGRGSNTGSTVTFTCNDVGNIVMITLRATDCNGNTNDCMVQAEVQDKIKPSCLAPAQVAVTCENFDPTLWVYGIAQVADNCCLDATKVYQGVKGLTHTVAYNNFDTVCNKGTIVRTFRAFDCHGLSSQCTQRVIVTYTQDYFLKFPNDAIVTVCDGTGNFGEPFFFGEDCELLGVSFTDEIFTVVPDACFKIERTWDIINWCTFNPNLDFIYVPNPNPNPQVNNPANLPGPTVSACGTLAPWAPTSVRINPTDPQPTNYCSFWDQNANGYKYKQIVKIIDGQAPTGTYVVPDCSNQNWLTVNNGQLWNEMYWWDNGLQLHDLCEEPTDLCI
ncbi:MAG: HYR domain-containing protein, partial [Phycisphaerae bacterium]|nr:HYR domain-containing protein [Saprospiraceae bacterium]